MGKKFGKAAARRMADAEQLPQNIRQVGDRVLGGINIYILQSVHQTIAKFAKAKTINESGGVLVGRVMDSLGKQNILITGFIEAKHSEATPTTLTFTHDSWTHIHREMDKKHRGRQIVGWIHTHPNFGIFLSEYDQFIHHNFFKELYQVAYVVDPIQRLEGFFCWSNGQVERCPGFYLYDEVGRKIIHEESQEGAAAKAEPGRGRGRLWPTLHLIITMALILQMFILFFYVSSLKSHAGKLQQDYDRLVTQWNLRESDYQQYVHKLEDEISDLRRSK